MSSIHLTAEPVPTYVDGVDANGDTIIRVKEGEHAGQRVLKMGQRQFTNWEIVKMFSTFPIFLYRMFSIIQKTGDPMALDPTYIIPTGKPNCTVVAALPGEETPCTADDKGTLDGGEMNTLEVTNTKSGEQYC